MSLISQSKKQEKLVSKSDYIETKVENSALPQNQVVIQSKSLLRRTLGDITINQFKRANFHGDYSVLVISGHPSNDEINEAWEAIRFEYASAIKSDNSEYLINLQKDIGEMRAHIDLVNSCATLIDMRIKTGTAISPKIFDALIGEGYEIDANENDPEVLRRQMARIVSQCKTKVHDLMDLVSTYEKAMDNDDMKPQTEEQFSQNLALLRKFMGYRINPNEYTMEEYVTDYNLLLAQAKKARKNDEQ